MTDRTSPDWLQDAINAIQDLDTAQDLVDGVASLQQENERLRGVVVRYRDAPLGTAEHAKSLVALDALLTGGE